MNAAPASARRWGCTYLKSIAINAYALHCFGNMRLDANGITKYRMELMKMMFPAKEVVERLRKEYPVGCRIVLDSMDDPYHHIPAGTQGVCHGVDDAGSVMVAWDCGSSLSVAYGADRAHRVASEEEVKKSLDWLGKRQRKAAGGGHCPRCGAPLESFAHHALSRRADIIICDADGTAEAFEDAGMAPRMPLTQWWCVQNNWKL